MENSTPTTTRVMYLQTNYNNKLSCDHFLHIDLAPAGQIRESTLQNTVFEIRTKDESHPPVKKQLEDLCRLPLKKVTNALTWQSHGMDSTTFKRWLMKQKEGVTLESEVAIYLYKIAFDR